MNIFHYLSPSTWFNPAGDIKKTTNELPAKKKAKTTVKKAGKKDVAEKAKKTKKTSKTVAKEK